MNKIATALSYIDEDLIFYAMDTMTVFNKSIKASGEKNRIKQHRFPRIQGGVMVKTVAISITALVICAVSVIWAVIALTGNHALDPYRLDKEEKIIGSFTDIQEFYPDSAIADNLSKLSFNDMTIALYYDKGTEWQDKDNWYSLIFSGFGQIVNSDNLLEMYTVFCLFTGTVDEWKVTYSFDGNTQFLSFGETQVEIAYNAKNEYSYAIFEKNGIIYDIRTQFGNSTEKSLIEVLELLLK